MSNEVYRVIVVRNGKTTWSFYNSAKQALDKARSNGVTAEHKVNGEWVELNDAD